MKRSPNGFIPARGFLQSGMAPRPSFNDGSNPDDIVVVVDDGTKAFHRSLRTPISTYQKHVRYAVFEFQELLDSSSIDAEGWSHIAQTIFRNYKLFDSFVILHGTDSLAYTCSALSFMLQNLGKPVILTGSQAPMLELQNDAVSHLSEISLPHSCCSLSCKTCRRSEILPRPVSRLISNPNRDMLTPKSLRQIIY